MTLSRQSERDPIRLPAIELAGGQIVTQHVPEVIPALRGEIIFRYAAVRDTPTQPPRYRVRVTLEFDVIEPDDYEETER